MKIKFLTILLLASFAMNSISFARGGGFIVGIGAGLVEQNFLYAYVTIEKLATECLETKRCDLNADEIQTVEYIQEIARANMSKPDKILFVSERTVPGFFTTGPSEPHRIAKTGLSPASPIYINVDLLYASNGKPTLSFPAIVALLTHEIGHQTGVESHTYLDTIGAKFRFLVEKRIVVNKIETNEEGTRTANVTVLNYNTSSRSAEIIISWNDYFSISLTPVLETKVYCVGPYLDVVSYEISNGHFDHLIYDQEAGYSALIKVSCRSRMSNKLITEKKTLSFSFDQHGIITNMKVEPFTGFSF